MKLYVLSVFDKVAVTFAQPFYAATLGSAIRSFMDELASTDSQSVIAKHPEDYDLYSLGVFNDEDASFDLEASPRPVARGLDHVRKLSE